MSEQFIIKTSLGDITISLYDDTPLHRDNFIKLAGENYYDGIRFHRVIEGFMIQTGDPLSRHEEKRSLHGTGGPSNRIPAEIKHPNKKGTLAAARDNNPQKASSGSQFYINHADNGFLDHRDKSSAGFGYAVFGKVTSGMPVINKIKAVKTGTRGPLEDVPLESVVILDITKKK